MTNNGFYLAHAMSCRPCLVRPTAFLCEGVSFINVPRQTGLRLQRSRRLFVDLDRKLVAPSR